MTHLAAREELSPLAAQSPAKGALQPARAPSGAVGAFQPAPAKAAKALAATSPPRQPSPPSASLVGLAGARPPAGGKPAAATPKPQGPPRLTAPGELQRLSAEDFISQLEPCVPRLLRGKLPDMLPAGVPGVDSIAVVHGTKLTDRKQKLDALFSKHGLRNVTFIKSFDGDSIDSEAQQCFFGKWVPRIAGNKCCNRISSVLKPHVAFFAMVARSLSSVLVLEDDLVAVSSLSESLRTRLTKAAGRLRSCDMVKVAEYAVAVLVSNTGARKMLHYSLKRNGSRIANPQDWQMDAVARSEYKMRLCEHHPKIFGHYGHGSNHGGSLTR